MVLLKNMSLDKSKTNLNEFKVNKMNQNAFDCKIKYRHKGI